jgi:hypothetical protein
MNALEVEELFIEAAAIDRRLPIQVRPAQLKSMSLPFVHTFEERREWEPADMIAGEVIKDNMGKTLSVKARLKLKKVLDDKLELGDKGRRAIEAELFWQGARVTPEEVTRWEQANELILLVSNGNHRRALMNWAIAKAGGRPFANWCRREGLLPETGRWRKNEAVKAIILADCCVSGASTQRNIDLTTLSNHPEISDKSAIIGQSRSWMAEGSRPLICDFDHELTEFSWAANENARRRQREAKRRAQAA